MKKRIIRKLNKIDNFYLLLYGVIMSNKLKLILMLVFLIILSIFVKNILSVNTLKYNLKYKDTKFNIKQTYNENNSLIEINSPNNIYLIRLYNNSRKKIDKIYYYKDKNYECLLPILNHKLVVDMMCYNNSILYNYSNIKGTNSKLDKYVNSIEEYSTNYFVNDTQKIDVVKNIKYYTNNKIQNIVAITTYKGLVINQKEINLFKLDIYNNKISTFVDKYYLIADYENDYEFEYFYIVDLETKTVSKIKSKNEISLDSYIQGIVDNKVYLYDKDNENQYEIDVDKKVVNLISSKDEIKYYKNKKWEKLNKVKANKEIYFDYTSLDNIFPDYDKVIESENYYYLFKQNDLKYDLYRVDKSNININKFIETIPTDLIYHKDDYIYYVFNNKLYYYSDRTGLKTLLEDSELEFNKTIKYYIY